MLARILLRSLQQAIRSFALLLFPLLFISMFAWATAGSASGNTSDPIRAALWLLLGAHLIPFDIHIAGSQALGSLTVLPIGAALIPFLIIRNSFKKLKETFSSLQMRAVRVFYIASYSLLTALTAIVSATSSIASHWYFAALFSAIISELASLDYTTAWLRFSLFPRYILLALWGVGFIIVGVSLTAHFAVVKDLTTVIQPGWVGGILFLILQILYLPNMALGALSYISGVGFTLGASTLISPFDFRIHQIPAIPLLGVLPTGKHPQAIYFIAFIVLAMIAMTLYVNSNNSGFMARQKDVLKIASFLATIVLSLAYLNSGSFVTSALTPVGIPWWKFAVLVLGIFVSTVLVFQYIPAGFKRVRNRVQ